jgi:uncharacterized membrane protein YphA (DoxX/SURF4 family)
MHKTTRALLRIILGLIVIVFGLDRFLKFIPMEIPEGNALEAWTVLEGSGFFFPVYGGLEILIGLLLISGYRTKYVLFALLPLSLSALFFYLFLYPEKIGGAAAVATLNVYLLIMLGINKKMSQ